MRSSEVSPPLTRHAVNVFVVYIFLCAASTSPSDCDRHNAVDVALGPEVSNEIMCGLEAQEMFARTAIHPKAGEYMKISCVRRQKLAEN
jgi:hypothetical protein